MRADPAVLREFEVGPKKEGRRHPGPRAQDPGLWPDADFSLRPLADLCGPLAEGFPEPAPYLDVISARHCRKSAIVGATPATLISASGG